MIATKLDRFLANLIDSMAINFMCLTIIGIPIAFVYIFLKDSLEILNFQSLGKKIMLKLQKVASKSSIIILPEEGLIIAIEIMSISGKF